MPELWASVTNNLVIFLSRSVFILKHLCIGAIASLPFRNVS